MNLDNLYESLIPPLSELKFLVKGNKRFNSIHIQTMIKTYFDDDIIDVFEDITGGEESVIKFWISEIKKSGSISKFMEFLVDNYNKNRNNSVDSFSDDMRRLKLADGSVPKYVYRVVDPADYNRDPSFLLPSEFYKRIHASAKPEKNYGKRGDLILQITYSAQDGWTPKEASLYGRTEIYAVTYNKIPKRKIKIIGKV